MHASGGTPGQPSATSPCFQNGDDFDDLPPPVADEASNERFKSPSSMTYIPHGVISASRTIAVNASSVAAPLPVISTSSSRNRASITGAAAGRMLLSTNVPSPFVSPLHSPQAKN